MGALAASIASHVPSGMLSAGLAALAALPNPGELVRKAARLEDELRELLRLNGRGAGAGAGAEQGAQQTRERFLRAYERLKDELLNDRAFNFDFTDETRQWVAKMLDYNVPGGKLNRGLSVIDSYMLLRRDGAAHRWSVCDKRRCAAEMPRQAIIKRYFKEKFYFMELMELWNEIGLQTAMGQMLDLITTHTGAKDLARYRIQGYRRIVKYKTSYYSFYLPVACALLLNGAKLSDYVELKNVLIEMESTFRYRMTTWIASVTLKLLARLEQT
ncbi:hypothetical protein ZWY2020_024682 [Hordeum vulgare]|nr:hypothetical protein ZWY2020_024682 [Hordeum vulgare]